MCHAGKLCNFRNWTRFEQRSAFDRNRPKRQRGGRGVNEWNAVEDVALAEFAGRGSIEGLFGNHFFDLQ